MGNNVWQWICRVLLSISLSLLISCEAPTFPPGKYFYGSQLLLAQAIAQTDLQRVKELAIKTDLNTPGKQDMTLLYYAFMAAKSRKPEQLKVITELVKSGADPLQKVPDMSSVANIMARSANPEYIEALINGGMSPNAITEDTPIFFYAARDTTLDTLKLFLSRGADINLQDDLGLTVVMDSLISDQLLATEWLLNHGATPLVAQKNSGWTFMHQLKDMITRCNDIETKKKLIALQQLAIEKGGTEYHGE